MEHRSNETLIYVISLAFDVHRGDVPAAILLLLIDLGFQSHTDGFSYLRKAIHLRQMNPDIRLSAIYQAIIESSDFTLTERQIDQAIWTTIDTAWKNRNKEKWELFFSEDNMKKGGRPTNKEFISQIACFMELWLSHCKEVSYGVK